MKEIKILTPVGMLGYGFPEEHFTAGMERNPDAVILDSGSTDPGPYMLGANTTMVKPRGYERDLTVILKGIGEKKIPLLIGSAGGAGTGTNVDYITDLIGQICGKLGLHKKIVKIYTFNASLKRRLQRYAGKHPDLCRQLEGKGVAPGAAEYEIRKDRLSIRLLPPCSEERRKAVGMIGRTKGFGATKK